MTFARARVRPALIRYSWSDTYRVGPMSRRPIFFAITERYSRKRRPLFDSYLTDRGLDGLLMSCGSLGHHSQTLFLSNTTNKAVAAGRKLYSSRFSSSSKTNYKDTQNTNFKEGMVARGIRNAILSLDPSFFDHETKLPGSNDLEYIDLGSVTDLADCKFVPGAARAKIKTKWEAVESTTTLDPQRSSSRIQDQFNYLITERLAPPQILLKLYGNLGGGILRENLHENVSRLFSTYLFENNLIRPSLLILLENLAVDVVIATLSNSIIPTYVDSNGHEQNSKAIARDIAIGDIVDGLNQMNQLSVAKQFVAEIGIPDEEADSLISQARFLSELRLACYDFKSAYSFIKEKSPEMVGLSSALCYPQLVTNDNLNIWTKLAIFQFVVRCDSNQIRPIFIKKQFVEQFLSPGIVLKRFIQDFSSIVSETSDAEAKLSLVSQLCDALKHIYYNRIEHPLGSYFSIESISYLPMLAYDRKSYQYVWNAFKLFVGKLEHGTRLIKKAEIEGEDLRKMNRLSKENSGDLKTILDNFLRKAVDLKLSMECSDVIVYGHGNFDDRILRDGLLCLAWAKKRSPKYEDSALYCDVKDVDTGSLERALNACPKKKLDPVLSNVFHELTRQFPFTNPCPGRILWNLLLAMQRSKSLTRFPPRVESKISMLITSRPHLEQLRYMALYKVSTRGIMLALDEYVTKLKVARDERVIPPEALEREADVKLVLSGLLLLNEKEKTKKVRYTSLSKDGTFSSTALSSPPLEPLYFGKMVTNLFKFWDENEAIEVVRLLRSQKIRLSDDVIMRCLTMLLHRNNYALGLQLLNDIPIVPPKAYYTILIQSSKSLPKICFKLMTWLKVERHIVVPSSVIRMMIVGFSHSAILNDSQSNRRVVNLIKILKCRGHKIGTEVAHEVVNSIIIRSMKKGWGSRRRLAWAFDLARKENVPESQIEEWHKTLEGMKRNRQGYWGVKYYHRPKFY